MTGTTGSLDALVAEEVEVPLSGMVDALVHHGACQSVPVAILVVVRRKEPEGIERKSKEILSSNLYLVW